MPDLKEFQDRIGYHFSDEHWLERALTHSSTNENYSYQRLEFLGDRVLGLVIAHALFEEFREEKEGGLAKRHTALVQGRMCAKIGKQYNFNHYIILSQSEEEAGGRTNDNIISDIVESVFGAIYIDGGYEEARAVILKLWGDNIKTLQTAPQDPKTELQEWVQAQGHALPSYEVVNKDGPDHAPLFTVRVTIENCDFIEAQGTSRRQAEKKAAKAILSILKNSDDQ